MIKGKTSNGVILYVPKNTVAYPVASSAASNVGKTWRCRPGAGITNRSNWYCNSMIGTKTT